MRNFFVFAFCLLLLVSFKSDKQAYRIYDSTGDETSYEKMLKKIMDADVVFFGEQHNNPICHWLELELAMDANKAKPGKVTLGAEMYESEVQLVVNEYLAKKITERSFKSDCRVWPNDPTDYKPLLDFAKNNQLKFIATNVPRRYAAIVNKKGFEGLDSLDNDAKKLFAPLPVKYDPDLKCYKDMMAMSNMGEMPSVPGMPAKSNSSAKANFPKAQAIKDATMAYFINKNLTKGNLFIHYNGAYHSDNFQGTVWYLKQLNPDLKIVTISSTEQEDINTLQKETLNIADFIICIPQTMTKTFNN